MVRSGKFLNPQAQIRLVQFNARLAENIGIERRGETQQTFGTMKYHLLMRMHAGGDIGRIARPCHSALHGSESIKPAF